MKYKVEGGKLTAIIERPAALPGEFVWKGKSYPLTQAHSQFELER